MSTSFGRSLQIVIDKVRGKERRTHPGDRWGVPAKVAQKTIQPSGELEAIFYAHRGRIAHKWHHYLEVYERHFAALRDRPEPLRILELGVSRGGSLELWRKYFGPTARIVGIDKNPDCVANVDPDNATVVIGGQSDPATLDAAIEKLGGGFDLVIDDCCHIGSEQIASFQYLYPRLSERGVYLCEDLNFAYIPEYNGGYRAPGTFIEFAKSLIDSLHAWYLDDALQAQHLGFAKSTFGIFTYLNVIVIEKRPVEKPFHVEMGTPQG